MKPTITASWGLVGDEEFDPVQLSSDLGFTPTTAFRKGEVRRFPSASLSAPLIKRKHSVWFFEIAEQTYDCEKVLGRLLSIIYPKKDIANQHSTSGAIFEATVKIHAEVYDEEPVVLIGPSLLTMIAELGATFVVIFDYVGAPQGDDQG
jgi:hypothetical protein